MSCIRADGGEKQNTQGFEPPEAASGGPPLAIAINRKLCLRSCPPTCESQKLVLSVVKIHMEAGSNSSQSMKAKANTTNHEAV